MDKSLIDLCEKFRKGLVNRRDFVKKVTLTTGGLAAASQFMSSMGLDASLIEEVKAAEQGDIVIEEGTYSSGDDTISYYLAKPSGDGPFPSMIVIHEIFGLSEFIKDVVRLFARTGYLAMAPCLPEGGCETPDGKHSEWMLKTLRTGVAAPAQSEIDKLIDGYTFLESRKNDVDPQHIGSVGFCWGGARSFTLATQNDRLWVAIVFYGSTPESGLDNITAPVLALYGALDNASPASITGRAAETARAMRDLNKAFEWEVYNLAPHAFFRDGVMVSTSRAATIAWELVKDFLNRHYERN